MARKPGKEQCVQLKRVAIFITMFLCVCCRKNLFSFIVLKPVFLVIQRSDIHIMRAQLRAPLKVWDNMVPRNFKGGGPSIGTDYAEEVSRSPMAVDQNSSLV